MTTTALTNFDRGYSDADNDTARILAKTGSQNRTVDKVEYNALHVTSGMLTNIEYAAGKLACWRDAGLPFGAALCARAVAKLREIADMLESSEQPAEKKVA